ncbi:MAG: (2Fe-2S)-binding protein [Thermoplasmata archaeon]|nr:MAG: (2Fe-2S)-binding protein [Thermoplasmata archaeon]
MDSEISLKIDGQEVSAREGMSVMDAARDAGIYIPALCNHPDLIPFGACRLCIVKIESMKGLPTSCTTPVTDGMVVVTEDEELKELRMEIMSLILEDHPHACLNCAQREGCTREPCSTNVPVDERCCSKFGNCELQKVVEHVGMREDTPKYIPREKRVVDAEPLFRRDFSLCILCGRCVRACRELRGVYTIGFTGRSSEVEVGTAYDRTFADSGCRFCGACVEVCPTGTLLDMDLPSGPREEVLVPCRSSCPAAVDVPRFLSLVKDKNYIDAVKVLRESLPLPGTIGALCPHPCEDKCRRGKINEPIAIADLHVSAALKDDGSWKPLIPSTRSGKKVAVVGSGATGLACSYFLRLKGHEVAVFEKKEAAGGRLRTMDSANELSLSLLDMEISDLAEIGIEIRTSSDIERPESLLAEGYDAVLLAVGSKSASFSNFKSNEKVFTAGSMMSPSELNVVEAVASGRSAVEAVDRSLGGDGEMSPGFLEPDIPTPCMGRIDGFAYLKRRATESETAAMTDEDAVYEAGRCLHCNLRLCISETTLPPEKWLALTAENTAAVPEGEGVYILMDETGKPLKIKGTPNLRSDLESELDSAAKFFEFEEDKMYSKRESELLQQHLQKYGEMPSGGEDDLDDLF